jgi:hypothetical protein
VEKEKREWSWPAFLTTAQIARLVGIGNLQNLLLIEQLAHLSTRLSKSSCTSSLRLRLCLCCLGLGNRGGVQRVWLAVRLPERRRHSTHGHLLPRVISPRTTATCLGLGMMSKLQLMQLHLHLWIHSEHLRWLSRRILGLPWVMVEVLLLLLLLVLELLRVLRTDLLHG